MKMLTSVLVLISSVYVSSAVAVEDKTQLAIDKAYITGFLAGAQLSDGKIMEHFETLGSKDQQSDFFQRAFRTRVGDASQQLPTTYYAGFCLPDDRITDAVVMTILKDVRQSTTGSELPDADSVFAALNRNYPCKAL
jgi:hypothetical protein